MKKEITINDVINMFLSFSIYDIKNEEETPNINFKFKKDGYELFEKVINKHEFKVYQARKRNLEFLIRRSNDNCLTIEVNDSFKFFKYLTDIINESIHLFNEYEDYGNPLETTRYLLRRIWLRMGINDIENIDMFLENQLQFVKNRTFDNTEYQKIDIFKDYDVLMKTKANDLWDETTRGMIFTIQKGEESYELPRILYDINDEGVCYVYAVQSTQTEKSKHIERKLYSLNKGIANPIVHPSKVYSLLLFINELKKKNISKIIVPSMQVLSYRYHELLSKQVKKNYNEIKILYEKNPNDSYIKNRYEQYIRNWYNNVYEKQDIISYLKTEELINLIYRITEHDPDIEITNEVNLQGDSINIKIR